MRVLVTDAEVTLADVLSLRISAEDPIPDGTDMVLRQRTTGVERRVRLGAPGAEARDAGLAVSLPPLSLIPGRWDVYFAHHDRHEGIRHSHAGPDGESHGVDRREVHGEDRREKNDRRWRVKSIDPGFSLDHLEAYALSRRTLAYRAYRTQTGFLALKISEARPVAEVRAVWFREGRFEVTGQLAYTGLDDDDARHSATLTLSRDRPDGTLASVATVQGVRFHAALSLCDMLDAHYGTWEPTLAVEGLPEPLRLRARLDDVDGKGRRLHYPAAEVDGVAIQPVYTDDEELRLEVNG
ncbi:hypothetical protein [Sinosporangium siamense]|uniref:Uncharacterized protein n=1 Tax=Sinosporangium siamense TaxID=1367973 RepID=A0A919RKV3_9ACTN|nr:hypothetical protein [Sinosporangium siamense]GII95691.1 hypothetical protein Ssi02_59220 [Sinosporangium siamense]